MEVFYVYISEEMNLYDKNMPQLKRPKPFWKCILMLNQSYVFLCKDIKRAILMSPISVSSDLCMSVSLN